MMERNEITEDWLYKEVQCNSCYTVSGVLIDPYRWDIYTSKEWVALVQDVWPEATLAYREQIIGIRSGHHICDSCWSSVGEDFIEDDDE
tara:strand:+ start:5026 stop:5292 length:267 start_codon:yes stop_codon:yes gene_type:complete